MPWPWEKKQGYAEVQSLGIKFVLTVGLISITRVVIGDWGDLVRSVSTGHPAVLNACSRETRVRKDNKRNDLGRVYPPSKAMPGWQIWGRCKELTEVSARLQV